MRTRYQMPGLYNNSLLYTHLQTCTSLDLRLPFQAFNRHPRLCHPLQCTRPTKKKHKVSCPRPALPPSLPPPFVTTTNPTLSVLPSKRAPSHAPPPQGFRRPAPHNPPLLRNGGRHAAGSPREGAGGDKEGHERGRRGPGGGGRKGWQDGRSCWSRRRKQWQGERERERRREGCWVRFGGGRVMGRRGVGGGRG